jgi:hypothetical protein
MRTALKTTQREWISDRRPINDNRRVLPLRERERREPSLDDPLMLPVYAFSAVLMAMGLVLLSL